MIRFFCLFALLTLSANSFGQSEANDVRDSNFFGLGFHYAFEFPGADMSDRFGNFYRFGQSFDFFRYKPKICFGLEWSIMLGESVKENVVEPLQLNNSAFLGNDGGYADVFLRMHGAYVGIYAQKIIVSRKNNPNSGLSLGLGIGLLQHNIRVNVESQNAPQFQGDYAKGYDRYTRGPAFRQNIEYLNIGRYQNFNYSIGLSFTEGFTKNKRALNFDTQLQDDATRFDLMVGLTFKWFLPISDSKPEEEIFY